MIRGVRETFRISKGGIESILMTLYPIFLGGGMGVRSSGKGGGRGG